jgi:hypothetical protein
MNVEPITTDNMATKSVRFKLGMIVKINSDYTGLNGRLNELVSEYRYKRGEHVRLLSYDSSDETWRVEKVTPGESEYQWLWIKRKNLAPISSTDHVENNPFKVGDKVELIDAQICQWAKHDRVTTGVVYEVIDATKYDPISQPMPYIKIKGGNAKSVFWIETAAFMKVEKSTSTTKSLPSKKETVEEDTEGIVEMVCVRVGVWHPYLTVGKTYKIHTKRQHCKGVYKVSGLDQPFKNGGGLDNDGSVYLTIERYFVSPEKAETEKTETKEPAPLQTFKTGDRVRFIQANTDKSFYNMATYYTKEAGLIDGEIYTVLCPTSNYGQDSCKPLIYIKIKGEEFNHPVDCFELVTEPKKVMCVNNSGECSFTIGKVYEVTRETVDYYKLTDDSGRPDQGMYKHRFVEITDDIDKR